jgi:glycerol uptake facilitator-like aquaporin
VIRLSLLAMFFGDVILLAGIDSDASAAVVTVPLLLLGLGIGGLASQLGSVTVSSVPDEESGEVGGLQNTIAFLGSAVGTALAGAVLISALTSSFFAGIQENPAVPEHLSSQAQVQLAGGVPFVPDQALGQSLADAGVTGETADAVIRENEAARLEGLRAALSVLAVLALLAIFTSGGLPTRQPGDEPSSEA